MGKKSKQNFGNNLMFAFMRPTKEKQKKLREKLGKKYLNDD